MHNSHLKENEIDTNDDVLLPDDILEAADAARLALLLPKSKKVYEQAEAYQEFGLWCRNKGVVDK